MKARKITPAHRSSSAPASPAPANGPAVAPHRPAPLAPAPQRRDQSARSSATGGPQPAPALATDATIAPAAPARRGSPPLTVDQLQRLIEIGHAAAQCDDPRAAPAQRAVELLMRLVATPSVSTHEAAASTLLANWMAEHGLDGHVDQAGNAVGSFATPAANTDHAARPIHILLLGHIDTVPGDIPVRMEHRTLYGRGAVDAKGSLAAFAVAASRLASEPGRLPPNCRISVVGAVEEECATSRGARFIAEQLAEAPPDACVIGEPSGADGVTLGYKGRLTVRARFGRDCAHSAGPDVTAAELAAEFWQACRAIAERHDARLVEHSGPFHRLQATLRSIHADDDGISQSAECVVGFRLPLAGPCARELEARVRTLATDLPFNSPGTSIAMTFEGHERPHLSPRSDAVARHLSAAIRSVLNQPPRLKVKTGTSDMNVVAPILRCPIVAYGPGDSALDHTPNEHIDLDNEYLPAIDVLVEAVSSLAWELSGRTRHAPA